MVVVGDILEAVQRVTGNCGDASQPYLFQLLSRAIQTLANKANVQGIPWDPLLVYVDLPVQNDGDFYVTLPPHVDKPLKVNLNSNPSFSHGQLFEFSLNGPGSNDAEIGWQWQDRGYGALQYPIPGPPASFVAVSDAPEDAALSLRVLLNNPDQTEAWVTLPIDGHTLSPQAWDVPQVVKPVTKGYVTLSSENGDRLAVYGPLETFPHFNRIKLSQRCAAVRMLCRRRTANVTSAQDVIPLHSEMAVILMCNAVKMMEELNWENAQQAETKALQFLQEEQVSRNSFIQAASASESGSALNLQIANRDSTIAADVYDALSEAFGPIGQAKLFDKLTAAIEVLGNLGIWDPMVGYADVGIGAGGYVTLPRQIDTVLALNLNGRPQEFRSKWFEFHLNGPGSRNQGWCSCSWSEYGEVAIAYDPVAFAPLAAVPYDWRDSGKQVFVYGTDVNGLELMDPDGTLGLTLTLSDDYSTFLSGPVVATVSAVEKDPTLGFVSLCTTDGTGIVQALSTYYPDDTVPLYRRIRVGGHVVSSGTARIRYRKRWTKITSLTDPIPLRSRQALLTAFKALKVAEDDPAQGRQLLEVAKQYLREEWRASNPLEQAEFQMSRSWGGAFHAVY